MYIRAVSRLWILRSLIVVFRQSSLNGVSLILNLFHRSGGIIVHKLLQIAISCTHSELCAREQRWEERMQLALFFHPRPRSARRFKLFVIKIKIFPFIISSAIIPSLTIFEMAPNVRLSSGGVR